MKRPVEFFITPQGDRYEIYEHCCEFFLEKRVGYENTSILKNATKEAILSIKEKLMKPATIIQMPTIRLDKKTLA